ncbi:MAG TPA: hypothetical protein VNC62_15740, partial [Burkholderiales bacterium]|nr:hypothetical protein [Burkholderiales bacterium]
MKDKSRREFITIAAGASALASLPLKSAIAQTDPPGTVSNEMVKGDKVKSMQWHSERPLTGSVPAHEHDFDVTPNDRMFVRNNLTTPAIDIHKH